jgi:hypothetical protein
LLGQAVFQPEVYAVDEHERRFSKLVESVVDYGGEDNLEQGVVGQNS